MKWLEVTVITSREFADIVSLVLLDAGSEGTVIRDSADIKEMLSSGIVWDYVDKSLLANMDPRVFVSGFFDQDRDVLDIIQLLNDAKDNACCEVGAYEITNQLIDSADWENEWKKYYQPIEFDTFVIVPKWITNHGITDKKIILLNPGMAFGTGSHETTSMCLKLMDGLCFEDKTVIDLGCGSGILGITAAAKGAKECILTDIDPYAIKCARENAALGGFENKTNILVADLFTKQLPYRAHILTANLTAPLLLLAKEGIKKHLVSGATVIISGILRDYDDEVLSAYSEDFDVVQTLAQNDWRAHLLTLKI